jgi:hypothetical protein
MAQFADSTSEYRFLILESMATEIRKLLLGALIFGKTIWKDELAQKTEGIEILKMIEEIEEAFVDSSLRDRFDKLENILNVIHKRAKGIFSLMEYISKEKQKTTK